MSEEAPTNDLITLIADIVSAYVADKVLSDQVARYAELAVSLGNLVQLVPG